MVIVARLRKSAPGRLSIYVRSISKAPLSIDSLKWRRPPVIFAETYRCCGSEITFDLGYMVWEDNEHLANNSAVPDSW